MSPTIVLKDGKPFLALGSPGGATIITTVLQMLVNRIDLGMTLPEAMAAPRASQRNSRRHPGRAGLPPAVRARADGARSHASAPDVAGAGRGDRDRVRPDGRLIAAAEPARRGGGSAAVVHPR